jgi:hypothetical protein
VNNVSYGAGLDDGPDRQAHGSEAPPRSVLYPRPQVKVIRSICCFGKLLAFSGF